MIKDLAADSVSDLTTKLSEILQVSYDDIRVIDTPFSSLDLQRVFDAVDRQYARRDRASNIVGYGTYPIESRVIVGFEHGVSEREVSNVLADAAAAAGVASDALGFVVVPVDSVGELSAVQGGEPLEVCSSGAWGFVWWNGIQVPYLVTAGHCADALRRSVNGPHDPWFNTVTEINWWNADVQAMSTPDWAQRTNRIERHGIGTDFSITATTGFGAVGDRVGDWVCKSGMASGYTCGTINSVNQACRNHVGMRSATFWAAPGDSGGSVYAHFVFTTNVSLSGFVEGYNNCAGGATDDVLYSHQENGRVGVNLHEWFIN
jgi:hypothetical protein